MPAPESAVPRRGPLDAVHPDPRLPASRFCSLEQCRRALAQSLSTSLYAVVAAHIVLQFWVHVYLSPKRLRTLRTETVSFL